MFDSIRKTVGALAIVGAALAGTAVSTAGVASAAPSNGELRAKVATVLNVGASRAARGAELVNGEADLPAFDRAGALIAIAPASWHFDVVGATENGDTINATLLTSTAGYEPWPFPVSWKLINGQWKLSHESTCTIGNFVGTGC
ncbi:hypothetical protein [Aldersonia kunmingensis]|uniref:hypothetical protein n=1 Tax=Aldersonia kunmingensis TaxID=408066 RepID=UPI0008359F95|nr:hypothetical protein [Aldersonia kunmingensis]